MCKHGLTCPFQHDPNKVALCPLFLKQTCPHLSDPSSCSLSHDPTPERTPICSRFNSTGDCYKGSSCLYPHIRVGVKTGGVCRDFAVLGYCEKGAQCECDHLKECPDFAATGKCDKMGLKGAAGCKLPHVIRANNKKVAIAKSNINPVQQFPAELSASAKVIGEVPTVSGHKRKVSGDVQPVVEPEVAVAAPKKTKVEGEIPVPSDAAQPPTEGFDPSVEFISLMFEEESDEDEEGEDDEEGEEEEHEDDEEMGSHEDEKVLDVDMDEQMHHSGDDEAAF
ncbi:hypothetical protein FRC03_012708 [Tulasnella sp. 419]|nr:hypothetical protein FRC03_012708 [Tulasnella sp. 419]